MNAIRTSLSALGLSIALTAACSSSQHAPKVGSKDTKGPELGSFGVDLSARNESVDPGDDFFRHANGAWLHSYELKPDEKRFGSFIALRYRSEDRIKAIIDELASSPQVDGSVEQKIADYYSSFMDQKRLNDLGLAPLAADLALIDGINSHEELMESFGRSGAVNFASPINYWVGIDRKNPDRHILNLIHAGLSLPDRDYYLEDDERFVTLRGSFEQHIAEMLAFVGLDEKDRQAAAKNILALETAIAEHHWPRQELRDRDKTYNLMTLGDLEWDYEKFSWRAFFEAGGVSLESDDQLNVYTPSALARLAVLIVATPLETWKQYLTYHLLSDHAALLSKEIDDTHFAFYGKALDGQPEQRDRWKRAVNLIGSREGLGEGLGQIYVERHFPPASKEKMESLVENLRSALRARIEKLPWMGAETKVEAYAKLESFLPKIGYPDEWRDYSAVQTDPMDLMGNYRSVSQYWHDDMVSRLGRSTDRREWYMTPQTVNAYYNPSFNEIVFPAAILQPPFFDPNADAAVNYGAIGAVIGHEMGHGFDDQGSKSDSMGVQRNWWTDADRKHFEERTAALVDQYASYEALDGHHVNGELTLGENIGDLGGLSMALHAYELSLGGEPAPVIEGLTGRQRFFLAWAQVWRAKNRDAYLLRRLKSDPHSPEQFRVNGVVRNMDSWYKAFDVGKDDALYLPPEQRVSIW